MVLGEIRTLICLNSVTKNLNGCIFNKYDEDYQITIEKNKIFREVQCKKVKYSNTQPQ
jgi:hypothetical protein